MECLGFRFRYTFFCGFAGFLIFVLFDLIVFSDEIVTTGRWDGRRFLKTALPISQLRGEFHNASSSFVFPLSCEMPPRQAGEEWSQILE